MQEYRPRGYNLLTPVVKNLVIINAIFFLATVVLSKHIDLSNILGLHYFRSTFFMPHQLVTYMFMHGGLGHIFFNMFALWMFGTALENVWGSKKFLIFYMITGIGAGLVQLLVTHLRIMPLESQINPEDFKDIILTGAEYWKQGMNFKDPLLAKLNALYNIPTVGASGSVFGILLGFGMLFPNALIYLYFAFPIKAKYFVIGYGALELFMGFSNRAGDNIAHFAHLGGMVFGYLLILYWRKKRSY